MSATSYPFSLNLTVGWKPSSFSCLKTYVRGGMDGCPLKTASPAGTICHAPGVLGGAGDRYFLQGACCTVPTSSWPLRGTCSPLPILFIFHRLQEKRRHAYHLAHSFENVSGLEQLALLGHVSGPRENTGFCSPWFRRIGCSRSDARFRSVHLLFVFWLRASFLLPKEFFLIYGGDFV